MADPPDNRGSYRPPIPGRINLRTGADNSQFPPLPPLPPPEERAWAAPLLIGVIGDTHMPARARDLPPPVLHALKQVDLILHTGDFTTQDAMERIRRIGPPLLAVRGNMDAADVGVRGQRLPTKRTIAIARSDSDDPWRIGMVHGDGGMGPTTPERALRSFAGTQAVDCVIFGHSHEPVNECVDGVLLFNPGSPTDRRRAPTFSYGILRVTDDGIEGEIIRFQRD